MTPAPSSSRNRRSATLSNIPLPIGPLPPPPLHGLSQHSPHSSFSSHSGPLSVTIPGHQPSVYPSGSSPYGPPRASFSSSRASPSPVTQTRSGREREQETRPDNAWRGIFDAALVKAQQAVQLDELQETALAANLYAQAANDLGRVISMCSSEKKKQSMLAIQAIYLDRVSQLKESTAKAPSQSDSGATGESHDGSNNYRYSVASNQVMAYSDETQQQYQPQPFQTQPHMQQQLYQPHPAPQLQQQYQVPAPIPAQHLPHQLHHIHHTQQQSLVLQQQQQIQQLIQQQTSQEQQGKGFRFFGKKRSKTQPSATHPPEFNQTLHNQDHSNNTGYSQYGEHIGSGNDDYSLPYMAPPRAPSPPPVVVSPIFMTQPPNSSNVSEQNEEQKANKSSKWRPFGKKKSKSFSNNETSTAYNPQQAIVQTAPMPTPVIPTPVFSPALEPVAAPHLVDPADYADVYSHQKQSDWYVENTQEEEYEYNEFQNQNHYYDDEDEGVDPYYIADTKGRAQAFEGENAGPKDTQSKELKEEDTPIVRKPLKHSASSYSKEQSFTPNYLYAQNDSATSPTGQADQHLQSGPILDEHAYTQAYVIDNLDGNMTEDLAQQRYLEYQEQQYHQQYQQHQQHQQYFGDDDAIVPDVRGVDEAPTLTTPESATGPESDLTTHPENMDETALEKSKSKRTWFGKKKKDKTKEPERFDDVARLMDEALFGSGSVIKAQKNKQNEKERKKEDGEEHEKEKEMEKKMMMEMEESVPSSAQPDRQQLQDVESPFQVHAGISDKSEVEVAVEGATDEATPIDVTPVAAEDYLAVTKETSPEHDDMANTLSPVLESSELVTNGAGVITTTGQDTKSIISDTPKRSKTRHFSIFKNKKNKDAENFQDGTALTPVVTNDDEKSMHSSHTRQSSQSADRRAAELAVALTVRPKEKKTKARLSDEYVPYEYQEELEGPLMERVEVPENREVIGFVMPVEEAMDYTLEDNEEAALENWDSWVSQLESFEKVLSNKGMKKEKVKKAKKTKVAKDEATAPMGSTKANRSSIFGLGSRTSTTLDLNTHLQEGRPLSMSTTLMDDGSSSNPRLSFQSSKSGGSEIPIQFATTQQAKKRWWNPKRKETVSLYRASNAFSMADLDQDRHLSTLLRSDDRIHSSDNLTLDTRIMSMPLTLTEPSTPAPEFTKDTPASMKSTLELDMMNDSKDDNKDKEKSAPKEDEEAESEGAIAPMPEAKPKAKSNKPKLLPISTPLSQLLKIENPEELWQYFQQAKTYASSRMNKGDKRSASIALKRAQALEARWQEVLLEMASSDEDTDELLEDEDEDEEEESEEEEVVVMPVKKKKAEPKEDVAPVVVTPTPTPIMNPLNTHNAIEDDDEEEDYVTRRRRNTVSRSSSTPDKYSKYKVNKPTPAVSTTASPPLAILTEEETNEKGELSVKNSAANVAPADNHDDGRLGPDATLEQMMESTNVEHLKFYIQRMKTDTVAKARNGSKFAALEGMKNVKVLQQRLADLLESNEEGEEEEEEEEEEENKEKTVQDTEIKEKDV